MAGMIPGRTLRSVLEVVEEISGSQYKRLLDAAGLMQYWHNLPPDDLQPATSSDNLARLFGVSYEMLGESLTRLFQRNFGTRAAQSLIAAGGLDPLRDAVAALPPEERLARFVHVWAEQSARIWAPIIVTEDADAWYMALAYCVACQNIRGAQAPICAGGNALFGGLAEYVVGRRLRVVEVECAALGAPACKHALYKLQ